MSGALVANSSELSGGGGGGELNLVEETGSALRPKADGVTDSGDATHAWRRGYFGNITLDSVDLDTRITAVETTANKALQPSDLLPYINRISALEDVHNLAIDDGTYETAGGDELELAGGLVVAFSKGSGGGGGGGKWIDGLLVRSGADTDHDLVIGVGACSSQDRGATIEVASELTIEIDNSGHHVNGSTLGADTTYYVLVGLAGGSAVAAFSQSLALPSGWDAYRAVHVCRTDSSSNLPAGAMGDARRLFLYDEGPLIVQYTAGNTPTPPVGSTIDTGVPKVVGVVGEYRTWMGTYSGGDYLALHPGTAPTSPLTLNLFAYPGWRAYEAGTLEIIVQSGVLVTTDGDGGIYFTGREASMTIRLYCSGYLWSP